MIFAKDPVKNPFNDWLRVHGVWVAVAVAATLIVIVSVIYILSKIKKH